MVWVSALASEGERMTILVLGRTGQVARELAVLKGIECIGRDAADLEDPGRTVLRRRLREGDPVGETEQLLQQVVLRRDALVAGRVEPAIELDEDLRLRALKPIERMLELSR